MILRYGVTKKLLKVLPAVLVTSHCQTSLFPSVTWDFSLPVLGRVNVSPVCYLWPCQLIYRAWFKFFSVTWITLPTANWHRRDSINHCKQPLPSVLLILCYRLSANQMNKLPRGFGWKSWICRGFHCSLDFLLFKSMWYKGKELRKYFADTYKREHCSILLFQTVL